MSSESMTSLTSIADASRAARKAPAAAKVILRLLGKLQHGALRLITPDGAVLMFGDHSAPVTLELRDWSVFGAAMRSGDIGFAEGFIDGSWKTDNLTAPIALLARNRAPIEELVYGSRCACSTFSFRR